MSLPNKIPAPATRDPRGVTPIANFPGNSPVLGKDSSSEIRVLVEQAQQTAHSLRAELHRVEKEKEDLGNQLGQALISVDELRANERELRSQFVEVTSIIRERDAAQKVSEQNSRALAEAQKRAEAAARDRSQAIRERDELLREREQARRGVEAQARSSQEFTEQISEIQRQLVALRGARDAAHAHNLELTTRLARADDEIAELGYQRADSLKGVAQVRAERTELRRQLDLAMAEREETAKLVETLTRDLDHHRAKTLDDAEQNSALAQADEEHSAALAEARQQVANLTQERDAARARATEQGREIDELRLRVEALQQDKTRETSAELTEVREKLAVTESAARHSRHEAANLKQMLQSLMEKLASLEAAAVSTAAKLEASDHEVAVLSQSHDSTLAFLQSSQEQLATLTAEREAERQQSLEEKFAFESQLVAANDRLAALASAGAQVEEQKAELRELTRRLEKQRLESIELAAQLVAAQRQIRELSVTVAEARLQAKFAMAGHASAALAMSPAEPPPLPADETPSDDTSDETPTQVM